VCTIDRLLDQAHVDFWCALFFPLHCEFLHQSEPHGDLTKAKDPKGVDWLTIGVKASSLLFKFMSIVIYR
jgi:hypothetical protein